jgi:hypothetical protein
MPKSNQWQWSIIALSLVVIAGLIIGISALVNGNQAAGPAPSETQSSTSSTDKPVADTEEPSEPAEVVTEVKEGVTVALKTLLSELKVEDETNSDTYDRDKFRHWVNVDGKCSAREFVLITESTTAVKYSDEEECIVSTGVWVSLYDGVTIKNSGDIDIDHMVPLKEAWESGAESWNANKRRSYANDVEYDKSLIAVSAASNRSKSDRDPADWMPDSKNYTCNYVADWISVKYRWKLAIDKVEKKALEGYAKGCETTNVVVPKRG